MNVTVFGATGAIGTLVVQHLRNHSHSVTAYVRNPEKVPDSWTGDVRIVTGEITDAAAIDSAVAGADAVISALGPSMARSATGLPLVEGNRLIVESMKRHGVKRFIGNGTPSVVDSCDRRTAQVRLIGWIARTFLQRAYREMVEMSRVITESGLDWTIVRFIAPKDVGPIGRIRVGFFGSQRIGWAVSRADIAVFTVAQLRSDRYIGAAPAISN